MTLSSDSELEQSSKAPLSGSGDTDMADAGTATGGDNQDSQNMSDCGPSYSSDDSSSKDEDKTTDEDEDTETSSSSEED